MSKKNSNLHAAKKIKNDEFYTQVADIAKEIPNYAEHLKSKIVYCNCDDPEWSAFVAFLVQNFEPLGLKKLIASHIKRDDGGRPVRFDYDGRVETRTPLRGDGDFRSEECVEIMREADVVITNPPFSLLREFIQTVDRLDKQFLVIGNKNAITYKDIFKLIQENRLWLGVNNVSQFSQPDGTIKKFGNIGWLTNLPHKKRMGKIKLEKKYAGNEHFYPVYDNFKAIEVGRVSEIPADYEGAMGVPITFLETYNPAQFDIVKFRKGDDEKDLSINGRTPYFRILVARKKAS